MAQLGFFDKPASGDRYISRGPAREARWYQIEAERCILNSWRQFRSTLLVMATGLGKCLGRSVPVLRYDGTIVPVEDVRVGDLLMGPDSRPRRVLSLARGTGPMFRITPIKGDAWTCNWCHILTLKHTVTGEIEDVQLDEYLKQTNNYRHLRKQFSVGVDFAPQNTPLPIDPYILGIWLGDGTKNLSTFVVSKPDQEIKQALEKFAASIGCYVSVRYEHEESKCPSYCVRTVEPTGRGGSKLIQAMRELMGDAPHVPHMYMTASRHDRLELLAGLLDTDGHLNSSGFEWCQKSKAIFDGGVFLARSLGLKVTTAEKVVNGTVYHRAFIFGDTDMVPTRIPRKKASPRLQKKDALRTGFSVEPIGDDDYFGFTLDGDGRFLLGDFTVTHNTFTFSRIAQCWPYDFDASPNVLVLAHREELVRQAAQALSIATGEPVGIEKADERSSPKHRIVVGSFQSMNKARLDRLGRDRFGLVIADEAHHILAPTYRRAFDFFDAKQLGVTATPDRADEKALGQVFEDVAFTYDIEDGIEDGFLVPLRGTSVQLDEIDISGVEESAGDLSAGQLDDAMFRAVNGIVSRSRELEPDRPALYFWPGVRCAEAAAARANALRPGTAAWVAGELREDSPDCPVRDAIRRFKKGELKELHNCQILTEGFDAPPTSLIVLGRPTKSRSLIVQKIGRGLRSLPGVIDQFPDREAAERRRSAILASAKPDCVVLDFVGNAGKHKLVGPVDALAGNHTEEEVEEAKKKLKKGEASDIREALKEAREKLQRAARQAKVKVKSRETKWNPFEVLDVDMDQSERYVRRFGFKPPSEKQVEALKKMGIPEEQLEGLSRHGASKLFEAMGKRREQGLATLKQVKLLSRYGLTDDKIQFSRASEAMTYLAKQGWGRNGKIDPQELLRIVYRDRQPGED